MATVNQPITGEESAIMSALCEAWNMFEEQDAQHPDNIEDFRRGIHLCQSVIATRIVMRNDLFKKE
jgi:hypothetical protein